VGPDEDDVAAVLPPLLLRQFDGVVTLGLAADGQPPRRIDAVFPQQIDEFRPLAEDAVVERRHLEDRNTPPRRVRRPERGGAPHGADPSDSLRQDAVAARHHDGIDGMTPGRLDQPAVDAGEVQAVQPADAAADPAGDDVAAVVIDDHLMAEGPQRPFHVLRHRLVVRVVVPRKKDLHFSAIATASACPLPL
jgi:hypothetical protein